MKFDQLTKIKNKSFDQTPKLTENFDQLKMSSEIRSSDHSPILLVSVYAFKQNDFLFGIFRSLLK